MADKLDTGRPLMAEASVASSTVLDSLVIPTVLVFQDVASLADSLQGPAPDRLPPPGSTTTARGHVPTAPQRANGSANGHATQVNLVDPAPAAPDFGLSAPAANGSTGRAADEVVTDEERTRYGLLLDSAAERGLLDPADYEIRLRELAEATTTAQMVEIVASLPAFTAPAPAQRRSRTAIQSANRAGAAGAAATQRRRVMVWVLMGLLVVVAVASLIILALSAERLSRSRNGSPPPPPAATRPVSALRL